MLRSGPYELQTAIVFGACCAAGGALLCAAWTSWCGSCAQETRGGARRKKSGAASDAAAQRRATLLKARNHHSPLKTHADQQQLEPTSPRTRRLAARQKSMSQSNEELSKLMSLEEEEGLHTNKEHHHHTSAPRPLSKYIATEYGDVGGTYGTHNKIVIAMVGLPARGKSYIVKMLVRYLEWIGFPTKIFNVGDMRRKRGLAGASANFFRSGDDVARKKREQLAMACQEEMYAWLDAQPTSCVAIFDATNTTRARREALLKRARAAPNGVSLIFVESICDDERILARNYRMKLQNADYRGRDPEEALADFLARVKEYEQRYETLEDDEHKGAVSYIKIINVGEKIVTRKCSGYLSSQISFFLGNVHVTPRTIFLALHAESVEESEGVYGASAAGGLTARGRTFARRLASFVKRKHAKFLLDQRADWKHDAAEPAANATREEPTRENDDDKKPLPCDDDDNASGKQPPNNNSEGTSFPDRDLLVLTGNAPTHKDTVAPLLDAALGLEADDDDDADDDRLFVSSSSSKQQSKQNPRRREKNVDPAANKEFDVAVLSTSLLNELCGGDFDGISGEELERRYPGVWKARNADKLRFRYPGAGGESYVDVIARLRPILIELERQRKSVLIVSHLAVLRCLYAYFLATPAEQIPYLQIPSGAVVELNPAPHGATATTHVLIPPPQSQTSSSSSSSSASRAGRVVLRGVSNNNNNPRGGEGGDAAASRLDAPPFGTRNGVGGGLLGVGTPSGNAANDNNNNLTLAHCARSAGDLATVQAAAALNGGRAEPLPRDRVPVRAQRSLS